MPNPYLKTQERAKAFYLVSAIFFRRSESSIPEERAMERSERRERRSNVFRDCFCNEESDVGFLGMFHTRFLVDMHSVSARLLGTIERQIRGLNQV